MIFLRTRSKYINKLKQTQATTFIPYIQKQIAALSSVNYLCLCGMFFARLYYTCSCMRVRGWLCLYSNGQYRIVSYSIHKYKATQNSMGWHGHVCVCVSYPVIYKTAICLCQCRSMQNAAVNYRLLRFVFIKHIHWICVRVHVLRCSRVVQCHSVKSCEIKRDAKHSIHCVSRC